MKPSVTSVDCKQILTRQRGGFLYSYTHTLNPFAGCAFGAKGCGAYCYAAESPVARFMGAPWGHRVQAKVNAPVRLEEELSREGDRASLRIFMSSATDPYQPAEREFGISRAILKVFHRYPVGLLVVQTRSPFVERDFDLLADMPFAWLSLTVETDDDQVRRHLTPICPSIKRRLLTMQRARAHGIRVQAAISPALPGSPVRFADLLADAADRVIVDTFVSGDGSGGARTQRRALPERYRELGWGDWRDESSARTLYAMLGEHLGYDRVVWSCEGFNSLR